MHLPCVLQHPSKAIQFLVGVRGGKAGDVGHGTHVELTFPGGRWLPEDGAHPASPQGMQALINTAIRTVKHQTGLDLSGVTEVRRCSAVCMCGCELWLSQI